MLVSDPKGRDIKMDSFTLSFHGRLLIENAEVSLNYGQRYGLLGENGSGKVRVLRFFWDSDLCWKAFIFIFIFIFIFRLQ